MALEAVAFCNGPNDRPKLGIMGERFDFHLFNNKDICDREGVELPDEAEALRRGETAAREMPSQCVREGPVSRLATASSSAPQTTVDRHYPLQGSRDSGLSGSSSISTGIRVTAETFNVQVVRIEKPRAFEGEHIGNSQPVPFENNQAVSSEFLDRAVYMNRCKSRCFGDFVLGKRKIARKAVGQAD